MQMIWHNHISRNKMSLHFEIIKPFVYRIIAVSHFKQVQPTQICESEEIESVRFFDFSFY